MYHGNIRLSSKKIINIAKMQGEKIAVCLGSLNMVLRIEKKTAGRI
jgi:hypothetical protein